MITNNPYRENEIKETLIRTRVMINGILVYISYALVRTGVMISVILIISGMQNSVYIGGIFLIFEKLTAFFGYFAIK